MRKNLPISKSPMVLLHAVDTLAVPVTRRLTPIRVFQMMRERPSGRESPRSFLEFIMRKKARKATGSRVYPNTEVGTAR